VMSGAPVVRASRVFVILNPSAGQGAVEDVRAALGRRFNCADGSCDIHVTKGHEKLAELARAAVERGCDVVIAAGGDGTISGVADGLVGTTTPLGIIPLGTANVLARELGLPLDTEGACALLAGPHRVANLDAIEIEGQYYFTQVGIGIDALMIRDTTREQKRRFGRLAYLWTGLLCLLGFQPRRFRLAVDDRKSRPRASQVILANSGTMGQPPLRWGPDIRPDDGRIDVCILRARTLLDYLVFGWHVLLGRQQASRHVRYFTAQRSIAVSTSKPLPVQADGEIIGQTPIAARVVPRAVRVVVP